MIRAVFFLFLYLLFPAGLCGQTATCSSMTFSEAFLLSGNRERDRIFTDYANLYNCPNVKNFGVALLGGAVLANTKLDGNFQHWHNNHVRSGVSNEFSKVAKPFGEGGIFFPAMFVSAVSYRFLQEKQGLPRCHLGEFTDRTMRGYLAGAPALLVLQPLLGGARPKDDASYWRPFREDHGVSGHAFVGAVPFITIAQMTDKPCIKGVFYALSGFTAWSRVNDNAHYLSQSLLGWYLAYLSVRAVTQTESRSVLPRGLTIFPVCTDDWVGAGIHYQF